MIKATFADKSLVVNILTKSFEDNKSVNYIIKQDKKRKVRIENLMKYSFDICYLFGNIFLSEDKKGCVLILFPEKKKTNLKSILLDIQLIATSIGLYNLRKAMLRESRIKKLQPKELMYYLWFIGVEPSSHHLGIGTHLMKEVIKDSLSINRSVYLETSTVKNIPWYQKLGFKIYNELDLDYRLYFMKKE